jgi:putative Mg2+ transporter-C (MgtC) family protein
MSLTYQQIAANLALAIVLGAAIGIERQWRQRLAGLRTNTLVALGAASFVIFASLYPGEASPTRVAAQVVSGIGFLGAGVIFKEGLNVRGLNTAATLWCSAAVGLLAGSGALWQAAIVAAAVVGVNLLLRPLVGLINRQPEGAIETEVHYAVSVVCRAVDEAHIRALLFQGIHSGHLSMRQLDSVDIEETDRVQVTASVTGSEANSAAVEQIVGRLSLEASVTAARWRAEDPALVQC